MKALQTSEKLTAALGRLASLIGECDTRGGRILVAGNGGFASMAQHFAAELSGKMERRRRPLGAIALTSDMSAITCIANDYGYERVFSRQLEALGRKGDLVVALTTSGRSKNVLELLGAARTAGIESVTLTGNDIDRSVGELSDMVIELPGRTAAIVQDVAMAALHAVCLLVERGIAGDDAAAAWAEVVEAGKSGVCDTLLLDRDGVINRLLPNRYVMTPEELELEGAFAAAAGALAGAYDRILVVTNQKIVGRGGLSAVALEQIHTRMIELVEAAGGRIDGIYCSTDCERDSLMAKPETGLADCIEVDFPDFEPSRAMMVGDSVTDRLFAERIGARFVNIFNSDQR